MKLYFKDGVGVSLIKTKKPSFRDVNGKVWDEGSIKVDDIEIPVYLETGYGQYVYFQLNDIWYKVRMSVNRFGLEFLYDIDPFAEKVIELFTGERVLRDIIKNGFQVM